MNLFAMKKGQLNITFKIKSETGRFRLIAAIFIRIERIFASVNHILIIVVIAHILMIKNERVSDAFLAFIASASVIINACLAGQFASSENFDIIL